MQIRLCQGIFYEIESKNQSCVKKTLQCIMHPLDIPDDATFSSNVHSGSASIEGEGLQLNIWTGSMPDKKGKRGAGSRGELHSCGDLHCI